MQFRVYDKKGKKYLKGWKEADNHFLGFGNDQKDDTLLSISFDDGEPDTYYQIELVRDKEGEDLANAFHESVKLEKDIFDYLKINLRDIVTRKRRKRKKISWW